MLRTDVISHTRLGCLRRHHSGQPPEGVTTDLCHIATVFAEITHITTAEECRAVRACSSLLPFLYRRMKE